MVVFRMKRFHLATLTLFFALATSGRAAVERERVVLLEDFESYTNSETLRATWSGGTAELATNAPGGGKAALHDGGALNNSANFSIRPDAKHNVVFTADLYDFGTNSEKRVTIALRNKSGANVEFGHIYETGPYAVRVAGFAGEGEWISFDENLEPTRGWHRFRAVVSLTNTVVTLDLNGDGKVVRTRTFNGASPT